MRKENHTLVQKALEVGKDDLLGDGTKLEQLERGLEILKDANTEMSEVRGLLDHKEHGLIGDAKRLNDGVHLAQDVERDVIRDEKRRRAEERRRYSMEKRKKACHGLLKDTFLIGLAAAAISTSCTLVQAMKFKKSLRENPDSLDSCVICAKEEFMYPLSMMNDFKAGVFFGKSIIDLSKIEAPAKQYDVDLKIENGSMTLIVPEDWHVHITAKNCCGKVKNLTKSQESVKDGPVLAIYAEIGCGTLVIKNED